jgi:hypothetical protein
MRGPTSPYGDLPRLWGASKAAYSSAIDAPYAYLVRRRGFPRGGEQAVRWGRVGATHGLGPVQARGSGASPGPGGQMQAGWGRTQGPRAGRPNAGRLWGWAQGPGLVGQIQAGWGWGSDAGPAEGRAQARSGGRRWGASRSILFAAYEGQRVYLPPISDHLEVHVRPGRAPR